MWKQNNMIGKINKHLFAAKKTCFNQCKETVYIIRQTIIGAF